MVIDYAGGDAKRVDGILTRPVAVPQARNPGLTIKITVNRIFGKSLGGFLRRSDASTADATGSEWEID